MLFWDSKPLTGGLMLLFLAAIAFSGVRSIYKMGKMMGGGLHPSRKKSSILNLPKLDHGGEPSRNETHESPEQ